MNPISKMEQPSYFFKQYTAVLFGYPIGFSFDDSILPEPHLYTEIHNHAAMELFVIRSGTCTVHTDQECFLCEAGSLLLTPAGVYHRTKPPKEPMQRFSCQMTLPENAVSGKGAPLFTMLRSLQRPLLLRLPAVLPLVEGIQRELLSQEPAADEMIASLLQIFCILLLRYAAANDAASMATEPTPIVSGGRYLAERTKQIEQFFSSCYAQSVTVGDLAKLLYLSPTQTNRILIQLYGQSFREKLRDTRLHKGKFLLQHTALSVNDIAARVGYASPTGFFAAFRRAFGMTPVAWRNHTDN